MAKIHVALHAIQKDMPTLEKNGIGPQTQGSYKFLSVDDVLKAVRPLLDEHGVFVHAELLDHGFHYNPAALKEDGRVPRESIQAWVKYAFHFVAVEDGSEVVTTVIGEGIDTQDKAVRKATTSAWKIALIQTFSLVTGELDPDAQDGAHAAQESAPAPTQSKISKAAGTTRTAAATGKSEVPQLQNEIREYAKDVAGSTGVTATYYQAVGKRLFPDAGASWMTDAASLAKVLAELKTGVTE